jgi:predicted deacylase
VDYAALVARLRSQAQVARITRYGVVTEQGRKFPLLRLDTAGRPRVVITAGFHGDEKAGPLTLAHRFREIAAHAGRRGVGLTVFPCINPSGFEAHSRYNASGEKPNNDFLRYEVEENRLEDVLYGDDPVFRRWRLFKGGPQETRAVRAALARVRTPVAALDLHQDNYMRRPATYAYVFGDGRHYAPLARRAAMHLPLAKRSHVDPKLVTDELGFIWFHDGSVTDWFMRRGSRYCAALETTTEGAPDACDAVNMVWIKGFIELAARSRKDGR